LIVTLPGIIPTGLRIHNPIELVDLLPSILDLLDISIPHSVQGQSFLNILQGETHTEERTAYCETLWPPKPEDRRRGLRSAEWKYFTAPTGDSDFLFHLPTDPDELQDLQAERPDLIATFQEKLIMISSELGDKGGILPEMSEEVKARLRALGYIR
jgi:arylsulfatase A-like enzyme